MEDFKTRRLQETKNRGGGVKGFAAHLFCEISEQGYAWSEPRRIGVSKEICENERKRSSAASQKDFRE